MSHLVSGLCRITGIQSSTSQFDIWPLPSWKQIIDLKAMITINITVAIKIYKSKAEMKMETWLGFNSINAYVNLFTFFPKHIHFSFMKTSRKRSYLLVWPDFVGWGVDEGNMKLVIASAVVILPPHYSFLHLQTKDSPEQFGLGFDQIYGNILSANRLYHYQGSYRCCGHTPPPL